MASGSTPALQIHLAQIGGSPDLYYFRGPVNVQYRLQIANPTSQTYTLRRLNLSTIGPGAYRLRTGDSPMKHTIPPNSTITIQLSTWANAAGGFLRGSEPVDIRGIAYFEGPSGSFLKQFTEVIMQ